MTKINKLIVHGFKSFAKRTELVFGDDFNCILGPNGSGKSNVLDALCFVLGRMSAKAMRVHKASNLIYNGGKSKKAMKQAEVSIFFDNENKTFPTEDPYVKLTRLIKSNGQSVYKINDQKRTRQQILDLMAIAKIDPEGYNIVLQGDIVRFTEMRPDDRRLLIEEISGISVYEEKKQKALKELDKVDERLKEAEVILAERNRYLKELKKDRDEAIVYKELETDLKINKASLTFLRLNKAKVKKEKHDEKIKEHETKINEFKEKIDDYKTQIESKKEEIQKINKEIEEKGEKGQVEMQKQIESLKVNIATNKTRIDTLKSEIEKIELRKNQLTQDLSGLDEQVNHLNEEKVEIEKKKSEIKEQLEKIEAKIKGFKENNELDNATEIEKEIEEIEKEAEGKQTEIESLIREQQELLRKKDGMEFQINSVDDKIQKVLQIEKENKNQIDKLKENKEEFKKAILELNKRLNEDSSLAQQLGEKKEKLANVEQQLSKLRARDAGIRESKLGNISVKKILEQKSSIRGIYGTVAELGDVDSQFSLALEVAAGPRLNSVVVEDDQVASKCIQFLKKNKLGTVTFIPLNKIRTRDNSNDLDKSQEGVHDLAVNLVSFDDKFKKVFSYVFGTTLVVEDLETARNLGIGKSRMVTLDGDLAESSGAMQGGYRQKKRFGFNEKEVTRDLKEYEELSLKLAETISTLESRRTENEEMISQLRERKANLEGDIIKMEKSLHLESGDIDTDKQLKQDLNKNIEEADKDINKVEMKISDVNKVLANLKINKQQLRSKIADLRNPELIAELAAFEEKRNSLKEELVHLNADIKTINTQINEMKLPEKQKITEILKQNQKDSENFTSEIKELKQKNNSEMSKLQEKEDQATEFHIKFKRLFTERDRLGDKIQEQEKHIEDLREESKGVEIEMNGVSLKNAEVKANLAGLEEEFKQYEGVKIDESKDEETLQKEIAGFERKVIEIGNVNMRALEIYEEIEQEYQALLNKKEKLNMEKTEVLDMMEEIEGKKKELFMTTFNNLSNNFGRIFSEISPKEREAILVLENPENPFEAGLDIKVKISGKKTLDIRSLSGGEKTMTALAFIFAIQEFEPHSFYILDEVDAALDKHNSDKLAKLVRQYCEKAQYVVISHNDGVISEADNLYGISMDEHGMTKVTTLKI